MIKLYKPKLLFLTIPDLEVSVKQPLPIVEDLFQLSIEATIESSSNVRKIEKPKTWEQINELETFFATLTVSDQTIMLNPWTTITDIGQFIVGHFNTVKTNDGNPIYLPYLERLLALKDILTANQECDNE